VRALAAVACEFLCGHSLARKLQRQLEALGTPRLEALERGMDGFPGMDRDEIIDRVAVAEAIGLIGIRRVCSINLCSSQGSSAVAVQPASHRTISVYHCLLPADLLSTNCLQPCMDIISSGCPPTELCVAQMQPLAIHGALPLRLLKDICWAMHADRKDQLDLDHLMVSIRTSIWVLQHPVVIRQRRQSSRK
jgi:hypothetical protein